MKIKDAPLVVLIIKPAPGKMFHLNLLFIVENDIKRCV
jgi:hypothetical protein